jgi:murein DD-endopeptidase MepM/ murein hydrolase activator NlpD
MPSDPMKTLMPKNLPGSYRNLGRRRFRGRHLFFFLIFAGLLFVVYQKIYLPRVHGPVSSQIDVPEPLPVAEPVAEPPPPPASKAEVQDKYEIRHEVVLHGDSLEQVLQRSGISVEYAALWEKACKSTFGSSFKEDDELIFFLSRADNQPVKVIYTPSEGPPCMLRKASDGWECLSQESSAKGPVTSVWARYSENFYDSCIAGGLPASLIGSLADIFAYDVDFSSDLADGDKIAVSFQEQDVGGEDGKQFLILAAEMIVSGKSFQAFGFQLPDGSWDYFDEKGESLKKAFLKSPLSYRRMISPSTYKNVKPVLKIYRPRLGIDYAAPRGTPVSAVGDGVISVLNKNKSAVSIEIRHRGGYRSYYGHLSAYSRGLKRGVLVAQGEVIGSVGSSGNGKQYLDFHFYKDSRPVHFQSMEFPRARTIPRGLRAEFEKSRDSRLAALQGKAPVDQKQEVLSGSD